MPAMNEQFAKARLRLWLRGEKALGLGSLPSPIVVERAAAPVGARSESMPPQPKVVAPQVAQVRQAIVNLFGVEEPQTQKEIATPMPDPKSPAFEAAELGVAEKRIRLTQLNDNEVKVCTKCRLSETRTNTVFGEGDPNARIFFIGEGPGENEDLQGRPFVGKAGQLLDKMIAGMGLKREQVFIANIVKCRPPGNRVPAPDEVATCTPYLERQLEIVRPRVIVTLGLPAAKYMLNSNSTMGRLRGQWQAWRGIKLMPTFHPAYLLRSYTAENRAAVWSDLKAVLTELGLPIPTRGRDATS
jgi:DNA polymerase